MMQRASMDFLGYESPAEALGERVAALARPADSVMFCLSKGLGAPVGSLLLGTRDFVEEARRWRKLLRRHPLHRLHCRIAGRGR